MTFVRLHGLTEGDVTHNGSYATTTDFLAVCVRTSFEIDRVIDSSFSWWQTRSVKYLQTTKRIPHGCRTAPVGRGPVLADNLRASPRIKLSFPCHVLYMRAWHD